MSQGIFTDHTAQTAGDHEGHVDDAGANPDRLPWAKMGQFEHRLGYNCTVYNTSNMLKSMILSDTLLTPPPIKKKRIHLSL